jgi:NitT/TauT family transport system substrate-binding protein
MFRGPYFIARHWHRAATNFSAGLIFFGACAIAPGHSAAEHIKVGVQKVANSAIVFIPQEKGYFAAEGLDVEIVYFQAQEPVVVGTASGDIDYGVTAFTGGFYNLAGQGALRLIGPYIHEAPGFQALALVASARAYESGLKTVRDLPGHSAAVSEIGSPGQYSLGLLADKYAFDAKSVRLMPMGTNPNAVSAVAGGQAEFAFLPVSFARPGLQRGDTKLIAWIGDEVPWQLGGVFTLAKIANDRRDQVERFLRAYKKGVQEFHDAFTGPNDVRQDGPTADAVVAIASKYSGLPPEQVKIGISYFDREARLDVKDILRQIAWYRSQGMVKSDFDPTSIIDKRYVIPLPEH